MLYFLNGMHVVKKTKSEVVLHYEFFEAEVK